MEYQYMIKILELLEKAKEYLLFIDEDDSLPEVDRRTISKSIEKIDSMEEPLKKVAKIINNRNIAKGKFNIQRHVKIEDEI